MKYYYIDTNLSNLNNFIFFVHFFNFKKYWRFQILFLSFFIVHYQVSVHCCCFLIYFFCGLPSWGLYILVRLQGLVLLSILQFLVSPFPDKPRDQWSRYQSSNRRVCRSQFADGPQSSRDREICANTLQPELPANLGRDPIAYPLFRTQCYKIEVVLWNQFVFMDATTHPLIPIWKTLLLSKSLSSHARLKGVPWVRSKWDWCSAVSAWASTWMSATWGGDSHTISKPLANQCNIWHLTNFEGHDHFFL